MEGPFFLIEGRDLIVYQRAKDAETDLEAIDVRHGAYRFFRADGVQLELETRGERVVVGSHELGRFPEELARAIRDRLQALPATRRASSDAYLRDATLVELVRLAIEHLCRPR